MRKRLQRAAAIGMAAILCIQNAQFGRQHLRMRFDSNGYLGTGWIFDPVYGNWFYIDVNTGMKTGWVLIDGKWYYFNPFSDGTRGIMFAEPHDTGRLGLSGRTGSWDEKR